MPSKHPEASSAFRKAAVLVPILKREQSYYILFTKRHSDLSQHAGQISFPGGKFDASDKDLSYTALREFQEEVGVPAKQVTLLGQLSEQLTISQYRVTPFYGLVNKPYIFQANPYEVAELIEIPMTFLLSQPILPLSQLNDAQGMQIKANLQLNKTILASLYPDEIKPQLTATAVIEQIMQNKIAQDIYYFSYEEELIWGVTASIVKEFLAANVLKQLPIS